MKYGDLSVGEKLRKAWLMGLPPQRHSCVCGVVASCDEQLTAHQRAAQHGPYAPRSKAPTTAEE